MLLLWCLNIIFPRNHLSVKLCGTKIFSFFLFLPFPRTSSACILMFYQIGFQCKHFDNTIRLGLGLGRTCCACVIIRVYLFIFNLMDFTICIRKTLGQTMDVQHKEGVAVSVLPSHWLSGRGSQRNKDSQQLMKAIF